MKILVCTDGSEQSDKAVQEAASLLSGFKHPEATLIHVNVPVHAAAPYGTGFAAPVHAPVHIDEQVKNEGARILTEAARVFEQKNIPVKTIMLRGHPATTITDYASEENFDLIALGSRGRGGLAKLLLGSTSNAVVQEAKCNVLVVK